MNSNPIGIFDSGVGGLSVWKEIKQVLPNENTIYLADSKNAPYGEKTKEEIIQLCVKNTNILLKKKCKLIVVACNTATTNAINYLRANYDVPFIGIEPALKPAALHTKTKKIGVLATKGTLSSALFNSSSEMYAANIEIIDQKGTGLVHLIENGKLHSQEMTSLLKKYTAPMIAANIDYLVLGCTHYPFLKPQLEELLPTNIQIIDSGEAVAKQTQRIIQFHELTNNRNIVAQNEFYTNTNTKVMQTIIGKPYSPITLDF